MEFMGFMAIMLITGLAGALVNEVAADPGFVAAVSAYSPWVADHSTAIGWGAAALIFIAGVAVPPMLLNRDSRDGRNRLEEVGNAVGFACLGYSLIFLAIPGIAYLLGMGWFAARKAAGF
ncbi:MAG: hypothetical protein KAX55_01480 [Propionivibrio sp.]|nr:hypothetical protein [Propionivibrio sp.]